MIWQHPCPAVQDNTQGFLADLVGGTGNADCAFSSSKGFVASQESEAMGILMQQHGTQVAVAQANLTLFSNRAGDGESFQPSPMAAAQSAALFSRA